MRLHVTHCCKDKSPEAQASGEAVLPDVLYVDPAIQAFFQAVQKAGGAWAVLSDLYGLWLPPRVERWYEKHPDTVTAAESATILESFDHQVEPYTEIAFYVRPETFHPFYASILEKSRFRDRIRTFTDLTLISNSAPIPHSEFHLSP
jgi:hypothetical protein